ncbi:MAG: hypothetical protein IT204_19755 [Fimbriimonadaceae bacterium]|nr:hypothetical protein [Fimbriimonadaceae bacterium]
MIKRMHWALALLAAALPLAADVPPNALETPAILSTYRALPDATANAPYNVGTVSLSARAVRELGYESFIAGPMQGEPASGLTNPPSGLNAAGLSYTVLSRMMTAEERFPQQPITVHPGTDGQYGTADDQVLLHLRIFKLPTRGACQKVVNHMMRMGLLPGDPDDGYRHSEDAVATGRWRVLVHLPRGKGAPPAPSLFYGEAVGEIAPDSPTNAQQPAAVANFTDQEVANFWGNMKFRWRQWDEWIREIYITGDPADCRTQADQDFGLLPIPRLLQDPLDYVTRCEVGSVYDAAGKRPTQADYDALRSGADQAAFFDAASFWENRQLDADAAGPDVTTNDRLPSALADPGAGHATDQQPGEHSSFTQDPLADGDRALSAANRPLEFLIHALDDRGPDSIVGTPDDGPVLESALSESNNNWWVQGINTSGPSRAPLATGMDPNLLLGDSAAAPLPGADFQLLATPMDLTIQLNGDGQVLTPGIGLVELQFEYETCVRAEEPNRRWSNGDPSDTDLTDLTGAGGPFTLGHDHLTYQTADVDNQGGGSRQYVRDPLSLTRTEEVVDDTEVHPTAGKAPRWRIRRYSGWPYSPRLIDRDYTSPRDYQGGPIICRFVVAPVRAVPEEQRADKTAGVTDLQTLAAYDPGSGRYYPQLRTVSLITPALREWERANFLLGYRADILTADEANPAAGPGQDYFYPVRPGARSESHPVWLRSVLDWQPGGSVHAWTAAANITDAASGYVAGGGYPLRGVGDLSHDQSPGTTDGDIPRYLAYDIDEAAVRAAAAQTRASVLLYCYDLGQSLVSGGVAANHATRGVRPADSPAQADVATCFDGNIAAGTSPYNVVAGYSVGKAFDQPSRVDRLELYAFSSGGWTIEKLALTGSGAAARLAWTALSGSTLQIDTPNSASVQLQGDDAAGILGLRARNTSGADLALYELKMLCSGDVRAAVGTGPRYYPTTGGLPRDPGITPQPVPAAAVSVDPIPDRLIETGTPFTQTALQINVPAFQPPSNDAIERQLRVDTGGAPASYSTVSQVRSPDPADASGWDRYRGSAAVYVDDSAPARGLYDADDDVDAQYPASSLQGRRRDSNLYQLAYRAAGTPVAGEEAQPATSQFVAWYEEDTGWVSPQTVTGLRQARLQTGAPQHVALEPYSGFDFEFSVAYERRLRIVEKLVDFGRVIHGSISQWVPVTLINEGNVPLRAVKLFLEMGLTPVQADDRASAARLAQMQPVPAWFAQDYAVMSQDGTTESYDGTGIGSIAAPAVGAPEGRRAGDVYLRLGRLDTTGNLLDDRRIPVGQPLGSYTGRLRAFVDDLGLPGGDTPAIGTDNDNQPNSAEETALGGSVTMKLTVSESPLWRIEDFWDNEINRRSDRLAGDLSPYDPNRAGHPGTYQPVPNFNPLFSNPDAPHATPTVVVVQDPAEFTPSSPPAAPNAGDQIWFGWSSLRAMGGTTAGNNWGVFFKDGGRPQFGNTLQTNYRAFLFMPPGETLLSANEGAQRNLYPNICAVPDSGSGARQFVLLWHSEQEVNGRRASFLQFRRGDVTNGIGSTATLQIPDDGSGAALVNKQVPRAFVDDTTGTKVLWVGWQSGEGGSSRLGFNAITMPDSVGAAGGYTDAIAQLPNRFVNYALRTPDGLSNVMEPFLLPSRRNAVNTLAGGLEAINVLYSAWSPLWQNQDVYWSRYLPLEAAGAAPLNTPAGQLRYSPMGDDGYRLSTLAAHPTTGGPAFYVRSLPGGRVPFPRNTNELLTSNANHTTYAASGLDWVMPAEQFRISEPDGAGGWRLDRAAHRGFADSARPLFDEDRLAALGGGTVNADLDPLLVLRVWRAPQAGAVPTAAELARGPLTATQAATQAARVDFDLESARYDAGEGEWVLPLRNVGGGALLRALGIDIVRVHPGLGRVTFPRPLYRRGSTVPVYVYATYRPAAWRITTDAAVDREPTAAFDWWERMCLVWKRTVEGGKGQLWYRTFSLAVPLQRAPVASLRAVVNDDDTRGDNAFNGAAANAADAALGAWSFTNAAGATLRGTGPYSSYTTGATAQGFTLANIAGSTSSSGSPGAYAGWNAAAMVHFGFSDLGRRVRLWYDSGVAGSTNPIEEAAVVPGLGPERLVPLDGASNESQPAVAAEHFYVGYKDGATVAPIMSTRFWLSWVSTRTLYRQTATGPVPGASGSNVFYGAFLPDFNAVDSTP